MRQWKSVAYICGAIAILKVPDSLEWRVFVIIVQVCVDNFQHGERSSNIYSLDPRTPSYFWWRVISILYVDKIIANIRNWFLSHIILCITTVLLEYGGFARLWSSSLQVKNCSSLSHRLISRSRIHCTFESIHRLWTFHQIESKYPTQLQEKQAV